MSASDRVARHAAVCGNKPGGASLYYLKETCTSKASARRRTSGTTRTLDTPTPAGASANTIIIDYSRHCLDQIRKLQIVIAQAEDDENYDVELTDAAIQGVTLQVLSKELSRERDIPLSRKLQQAVRIHNIRMDEENHPEDKAKICPQLYYEVPPLLHFHYSGVIATMSGGVV
jgi:hypothetical protein